MTCLRHRFSGFVWQQEARPLSILETNKPEKPLQPSEPPQRNPAPTWLRKTFTRQRKKKVFISSARNCASKRSFVQDGWAPCPSQSPHGNVPRPTAHRSGTWLPAAACPAPVLAEEAAAERRPRRCAAPCAPGASGGAGTRRSAANHTAAGGGEGCGHAPRTGRSDALLGAQKAPRTPSSRLPPQEQGRAPAVPPNAARAAPATAGLLLSPPKPCSIPPSILWRKVLHPVWYHPRPRPHC